MEFNNFFMWYLNGKARAIKPSLPLIEDDK